jgi:hypothetical protein
VTRSEFNTPLLNDVFKKTEETASNDILCYANADIIFQEDFINTVKKVASRKRKFLITGKRWNVDVNSFITFERGWEMEMRKKIAAEGVLFHIHAMDYFIFKKGSIGELPPFAVGRPRWDNWMIYQARRKKIPVIDATGSITCIHQNHHYDHLKYAEDRHYAGPESLRNKTISGLPDDVVKYYSTLDANYVIKDDKLIRLYLRPLKRPVNNRLIKIKLLLSKVNNPKIKTVIK